MDDNVPAFEKIRVSVDNQFVDSQELTLLQPTELCVPTEKDGVPSSLEIQDHFQCYKVDKKSVKKGFDPIIEVSLEDQFQSVVVKVGKPVSVCNPVNKNGEGINAPENHLTCYSVKVLDKQEFDFTASITNQFDTNKVLKLLDVSTLCVPSAKTELQ